MNWLTRLLSVRVLDFSALRRGRKRRIYDRDGRTGLRTVLAIFLSLFLIFPDKRGYSQDLSVPVLAAATSMRFVLEEIRGEFKKRSGLSMRTVYGATRRLVAQIENGAPFDILLTADEASARRLQKSGHTHIPFLVLAQGRLVVAVPSSSPLSLSNGLLSLRRAVEDGSIKKLSIANAHFAPYGTAAIEVLESIGLLGKVRSRLVIGENAAQAAQFIISGAVDIGLIPRSFVKRSSVAQNIRWADIEREHHRELRQVAVLLKTASRPAVKLFHFFCQDVSRRIFTSNGFERVRPSVSGNGFLAECESFVGLRNFPHSSMLLPGS